MLCYKDKVWCTYYKECSEGESCPKAFTPTIKKEALTWWGESDGTALVSCYVDVPHCFINKYINERTIL